MTIRNTKHGLYYELWYQNHRKVLKTARKRGIVPAWANIEKIAEIYRNCPDGMDVDHIIPMGCKKASGLHCEFNLQYLTRFENQSKLNKLPPEYRAD